MRSKLGRKQHAISEGTTGTYFRISKNIKGRIFVDPAEFRKGYGIAIMEQIENICSEITVWELDIPIWNIRTNQFYKKMGYTEIKRDEEFVFYRKSR